MLLRNVRILDFTDAKGMLCGKLLADMGAEVIIIDKPGSSSPQSYAAAGKRSITLDITKPAGQGLFKQLAAVSDILIESFSPGTLDKAGIGYQDCSKINPELIFCSITLFGQNGPYHNYQASELVAGSLGGSVYVNGDPDKEPLKLPGAQSYNTAGLYAANAVMLALWKRNNTGKGSFIDVSVQECTASTLDHILVRQKALEEKAVRRGGLYWNNAFQVFRCKDGYALLTLLQQWDTLVEWLDSEGMAADLKDDRWSNDEFRQKNIDHITAVIGEWTIKHSVDELVETGQLMRFPWARISSPADVLSDEQLTARGYFETVEGEAAGRKYIFPGAPVKMSGAVWTAKTEFAQPGEANEEIYINLLGMSEQEFSELRSGGVI